MSENESDLVDDLVLVEEVEEELILPVWEPTGGPKVDAALDLLAALDPARIDSHAPVFNEVHQQLRTALSDLDSSAS